MKQLASKWTSVSLIVRIVVFLIIGALLGSLCPSATVFAVFGTVFVGALKGVAPVLVFVLVSSSLSKANVGIGSRFRTVVILYMISTFMGAFVAVMASFTFKVTMVLPGADSIENVPPGGIGEVLKNLLTNMVMNPVTSIANANYIGILFWAILLGLALRIFAKNETLVVFNDMADAVSTMVRWIIQFAPFGIMGLVFDAVSTSGLAIFKDYGKLLALLVGSMLFVAFIVSPLIVAIFLKRNPYPLVWRCIKQSGVTAFFTRSSAANIPVNMELCEELGLEEDFYSVSIPLGATINMNGAAITITIMSLATAHTMGIAIDIPTALILSIIATLGACGASGVAGGSLLLIPMACSLFGVSNDIAMQAVAVGFIIGVIQDSLETALNSSGDAIYTATAEFHDRLKRGEKVEFLEK